VKNLKFISQYSAFSFRQSAVGCQLG